MTRGQVQAAINISLWKDVVPPALKEPVVCPLLKKDLDPRVLDNFCPVSNLSFLGKVNERVVGSHLQRTLDGADYLNPFQVQVGA